MCIGATNQSMSPVTALLGYLSICPMRSGPLFIFQDGSTLSRERLVSSIHQVLSDMGVSMVQYSGHSFHIGAATMAAKLGVPDSLIKKMADGYRPCLYTTFALRGSSWQASHRG